ncbi:MAG: hypothetical protein J6N43_02445, partial [Prevotella sp.]|nr:hypothetical protein [Prevotella sp.]
QGFLSHHGKTPLFEWKNQYSQSEYEDEDVPSSVNGLYTPLGLPVSGEQKRLSTYWSARKLLIITTTGTTRNNIKRLK